jgi:hypothetical protein
MATTITVVEEDVVIQVATSGLQGGQGPKGDTGTTGATGNGISSIARTSGTGAAGTTDTYTITYTSGATTTFNVVNGANGTAGRGISSITRTSGDGSAGTTDTYTITYTSGSPSTFTVVNGANGTNGTNGAVGPAGKAAMPVTKVASADWIALQYTDATAAARTQGREYCQPISFPYDISIDRISIYIITAGSATAAVRLGIRADNNGRPGTILQDCGAISTAAVGFATGTVSQTLTAGVTYWLCAMPTGAFGATGFVGASPRYPGQWLPGTCGSTTQTRQAIIGYYQDVTSGSTSTTALPTSFTRAGDLTINAGDGYSWSVRTV